MAEDEPKRYLVIVQLRSDTPTSELAKIVPGLQNLISNLSKTEMEIAFRSPLVFGFFFKTTLSMTIVRAELDKATGNGDGFLILEAGKLAAEKAFGRAATWLQRY